MYDNRRYVHVHSSEALKINSDLSIWRAATEPQTEYELNLGPRSDFNDLSHLGAKTSDSGHLSCNVDNHFDIFGKLQPPNNQ